VVVAAIPPCDSTTEIATIAAITNNRNPAPIRYICKGNNGLERVAATLLKCDDITDALEHVHGYFTGRKQREYPS
jgi:hypothetical protein